MTAGMRTWQEKQSGVVCPHHGDSPRLGTSEPDSTVSLHWAGSLGEAGQRGQQEPIRATAATGSSCRHPVPKNKLSPPAPVLAAGDLSPRGQWARRPRCQERLHVRTLQPAASEPVGMRCLVTPAPPGKAEASPRAIRRAKAGLWDSRSWGRMGHQAGRRAVSPAVCPTSPEKVRWHHRLQCVVRAASHTGRDVKGQPGDLREGPAGRPAPPRTWAGLAFISGCG